jgi:molybdate transport system regulatory protein
MISHSKKHGCFCDIYIKNDIYYMVWACQGGLVKESGNLLKSFSARSKVWIVDSRGEIVFGFGRYRILSAVERLGSLNAAARELKMSYKGLWSRIQATEQRLGWPLLIKDATGSQLTPEAEDLLKRYRRINQMVALECDEIFDMVVRKALETKEE